MKTQTCFAGVTIIGAGLTGLSAAYELTKAGIAVRIYEQNPHAGGRTYSLKQDGFVFDVGAITLLPTYSAYYQLMDELSIKHTLSLVQPKIGVVRNDVVHTLDLAQPIKSLATTKLLPLKAKFSALKLAKDLYRAWPHANSDSLAPLADFDRKTVGARLNNWLHPDVLSYLADPIIGGNTLNSTYHAPYGELLWMLRQYAAPYLCALDGGINTLALALAERLPVAYQHQALEVRPHSCGVNLTLAHPDGIEHLKSQYCLLALPPPQLAGFSEAISPLQKRFFQGLTPLPSISLHVGLSQKPMRDETFILPPSTENPIVATIVQDHLKAPGRAPTGKAVLSIFCRADYARGHMHLTDEAFKNILLEQLSRYFGDIKPYIESSHLNRWPYAIIQSETGLYQRFAEFEKLPSAHPNIAIAGDYLSMGMEAAVRAGQKAAQQLIKQISA